MMGFSSVRLEGDVARVAGPFSSPDDATVHRLEFTLAQPGVAVQGEGVMQGDANWTGEVAAGGLHTGQAFAFGVASLVTPKSPPGFQTVTWLEEVQVSG